MEPTHKRKHKRRPKVVLMPLPVLRSASRKHHARDAQPSQEASGTQEIEMEGLEHEALQKDDKAQYKLVRGRTLRSRTIQEHVLRWHGPGKQPCRGHGKAQQRRSTVVLGSSKVQKSSDKASQAPKKDYGPFVGDRFLELRSRLAAELDAETSDGGFVNRVHFGSMVSKVTRAMVQEGGEDLTMDVKISGKMRRQLRHAVEGHRKALKQLDALSGKLGEGLNIF